MLVYVAQASVRLFLTFHRIFRGKRMQRDLFGHRSCALRHLGPGWFQPFQGEASVHRNSLFRRPLQWQAKNRASIVMNDQLAAAQEKGDRSD